MKSIGLRPSPCGVHVFVKKLSVSILCVMKSAVLLRYCMILVWSVSRNDCKIVSILVWLIVSKAPDMSRRKIMNWVL
jgi:hypothetical protein